MAIYIDADLTDETSVKKALAETVKTLGAIDGLVNIPPPPPTCDSKTNGRLHDLDLKSYKVPILYSGKAPETMVELHGVPYLVWREVETSLHDRSTDEDDPFGRHASKRVTGGERTGTVAMKTPYVLSNTRNVLNRCTTVLSAVSTLPPYNSIWEPRGWTFSPLTTRDHRHNFSLGHVGRGDADADAVREASGRGHDGRRGLRGLRGQRRGPRAHRRRRQRRSHLVADFVSCGRRRSRRGPRQLRHPRPRARGRRAHPRGARDLLAGHDADSVGGGRGHEGERTLACVRRVGAAETG